jgi:lipopolysaccharide export system protein LptA
MRPLTPLLAPDILRAALAVVALACAGPAAHAEKADRTKPMSVTSGGDHPDVVDLKKHSAVFTGNVVITQGTLEIHADRVEVSQDPDGNQLGYAFGSSARPATFRQKRDGADEYSEGDAQKIEYDSAANRVRFVGAAHLRMLKGVAVTDQANAALITYDTASETIKLGSGEPGSPTAASGGRTTVIFTPKASSAPKAVEELKLPAPASGPSK